MSKTKAKLVDAAITYLNSKGKAKMSVKKLIELADLGYGTFYNHFDSIEAIQFEALSKTVKDMLIDFKLNVINEKDYVYIIYLALLRALNLLSNSPSIKWLLEDIQMVVKVFKEITQPNMENTFLNAVKARQIKNTDIEDLMDFRLSRHYVQWAAMGAIQQIIDGDLSEREAFKQLAKNVRIVDIPNEQRDAVIERILKERHPWEIMDNVDK